MRISACLVRAIALLGIVASPVLAFKPNEAGHLGITTEALTPITRTVDGQTLQFSEHALREIRDANRNVDIITFLGVEEHFDDEAFGASTQRLIDLKASVIDHITAVPPDGTGARTDLGGALHTLQDFYSHSNWIELGNAAPEPRLGNATFESLPQTVPTCPASPGTLGGEGLVSTTTGYFPFPDPCAMGSDATPIGKCRHGVEFICPDGINKDAPGRPGYETARALAVSATNTFVNEILDDPSVAGNATAIGALMDAGGADAAGSSSGSILLMMNYLGTAAQTVNVPVDSTVKKVTFLLTIASGIRVDVIRPSGAVVAAGEPGVTMQTAGTSRTIAIDDPQDGRWQVRVGGGKGQFTLDARVESPLQFDRFDFVTLSGRIGHAGFGTISGEPKRETKQLGLADLDGPSGSPKFSLIDDRGIVMQPVSLTQGDVDAAAGEYLGLITIPKNFFRVAVTGTDPAGLPYQRMAPRLYKPTK